MLVQHNKKASQHILLRLALIIAPIVVIFTIGLAWISQMPVSVAIISTVITGKPQIKSTTNLPVRLKISKIDVDATIDYTGLTTDGAMDIKKDPTKTAWYSLGPRPGENGSAVIAGHYGWTNDGQGAVFNKLHTLKKGDEVATIDTLGIATNFIVRDIQKYNPDADASSIFTSNDGKSHLNLVTCDGVWDNANDTYSDRLVIFTDKEIK